MNIIYLQGLLFKPLKCEYVCSLTVLKNMAYSMTYQFMNVPPSYLEIFSLYDQMMYCNACELVLVFFAEIFSTYFSLHYHPSEF